VHAEAYLRREGNADEIDQLKSASDVGERAGGVNCCGAELAPLMCGLGNHIEADHPRRKTPASGPAVLARRAARIGHAKSILRFIVELRAVTTRSNHPARRRTSATRLHH